MKRPLKLVIADDPLGSVRALVDALEPNGFSPAVREVRLRQELDSALSDGPCDVLLLATMHPENLTDAALDRFGADPSSPPIILVAPGTVGGNDPVVVEASRRGASEYVGSDDVSRFVAAIEREGRARPGPASDLVSGPDQTGDPALRAGIVRDQARLLGMQKMEAIGRLAGGIAHDFNNIVQVIGGFSELLLRDLDWSDRRRQSAIEIRRAGERAAALTRQLLAFSKQQVLQPRVLDLNETVAAVQNLVTRLIGENIELRATCATDLWTVCADATQVEQVLMNLVVNARDAMPAGGTLTIETGNTTLSDADSGGPFTVAPGEYVVSDRLGHRRRHGPRSEGPCVRAVLHHQADGPRDRSGSLDGLRHREAERRLHLDGLAARRGDARPRSTCRERWAPACSTIPRPHAPPTGAGVRRCSSSKTKRAFES